MAGGVLPPTNSNLNFVSGILTETGAFSDILCSGATTLFLFCVQGKMDGLRLLEVKILLRGVE